MKNLKHIWTVLAQNSSIDSNTKQLSIFNCLEGLNVEIDKTKIPPEMRSKILVPVPFQAISFWSIENFNKNSSLETKIEFLSPERKVLHAFEKKYKIKAGSKKFRNIINFAGIPLTETGRYFVIIYQKEMDGSRFKVVAEIPLDIEVTSGPIK